MNLRQEGMLTKGSLRAEQPPALLTPSGEQSLSWAETAQAAPHFVPWRPVTCRSEVSQPAVVTRPDAVTRAV